MDAHNHGPEEGPGLGCKEKVVGECQELYTEREVRLREREAFEVGAAWGWDLCDRSVAGFMDHLAEAKRRYPITKKVPREVRDADNNVWRYDGDAFHVRYDRSVLWYEGGEVRVTPDRVRTWADLLANPFEEVPE